jgi:aminopeptidase N
VGRDYVSGAMENTTATLHQESAYQNARQLTDGNMWEETIAHELFHQWFGDLVTTESWSNITVNESFANYSEYLWDEYKHGKDFADAHHYEDMQGYLMSGGENKNLVRFYYSSREDVFDGVSYNKGGRILHMLRNYVGDDAFFKSLNNYLTTNKFKTGEAHQLRLAFEEVTGKDLNWFWNQWYYGSGHPKLTINYDYSTPGKAAVAIKQTQKSDKPFILPVAVDIYTDGKKVRQNILIQNMEDTFYFNIGKQPDWISVDADRILLAEITDNKTMANYSAQLTYGKNYMDRKDALVYFAKKRSSDLIKGLKDPYFELRIETIKKLSTSPFKRDSSVIADIESLAKKDVNKKVKAAAIEFLGKIEDAKYKSLFEAALNDSSYSVAGEAFVALLALDNSNDYILAKKYAADAKGTLQSEISKILLDKGTDTDFEIIAKAYGDAPLNQEKLAMSNKFLTYLCKVSDISKVKSGIDKVITLRNMIPEQYRYFVDQNLKDGFDKLSKSKGKEIEDYINNELK